MRLFVCICLALSAVNAECVIDKLDYTLPCFSMRRYISLSLQVLCIPIRLSENFIVEEKVSPVVRERCRNISKLKRGDRYLKTKIVCKDFDKNHEQDSVRLQNIKNNLYCKVGELIKFSQYINGLDDGNFRNDLSCGLSECLCFWALPYEELGENSFVCNLEKSKQLGSETAKIVSEVDFSDRKSILGLLNICAADLMEKYKNANPVGYTAGIDELIKAEKEDESSIDIVQGRCRSCQGLPPRYSKEQALSPPPY